MFSMYVLIELINVKQMKNSRALLVKLGAHNREIGFELCNEDGTLRNEFLM